MSQSDRLADLSDLRDRLRAELGILDALIGQLEADNASTEHELRGYDLGELWGATKLSRRFGVSPNTARKLMKTDLAHCAWTDAEGRLRVKAADLERWIAQQAARGAVA